MGGRHRRRLLLLNRSFHPDQEATGRLLTDLATALCADFDVTVVCGAPERPASEDDRARSTFPRGLSIVRVPHTRFAKRRFVGRLLNWATYALTALVAGLFRRRWHVILVASDPPIISTVAWILGWFHKCPVVVSCQDLYAEVALRIGVVKRGLAYDILNAMTRQPLRRAVVTVVPSKDMADELVTKGLNRSAVTVIPNWADVERLAHSTPRSVSLRESWSAGARFLMMYAGNVGLAQDFDTWIEALRSWEVPRRDWKALIVGAGVRRDELIHNVRNVGLAENVLFIPPQPENTLPDVLRATTLHVVPLRRGLAGCVAPSKVYGIMAVGRPYLAISDDSCDMVDEIRRHRCGLWAPAGAVREVRNQLLWAFDHPPELEAMGARGAVRARADYDAAVVLPRWRDCLVRAARSVR